MPVRSFHIEDLLNCEKESNSISQDKQSESELIDVEDHKKQVGFTYLCHGDVSFTDRKKVDRVSHSEG